MSVSSRPGVLLLGLPLMLLAMGLPLAPGARADAPEDTTEASTLLLRLELPASSFRPILEHTHNGQGAPQLGPHEWIPLGGGTGFMRYQAKPQHLELALAGNQLLSHASIEFSLEYAKQVNGAYQPFAHCGLSSTAAQAGLLLVSTSSRLWYQRDYTFGTSSQVTKVDDRQPCWLGPKRVNGAPLMAQVYRKRLESLLPSVDRQLQAASSFKGRIAEAWSKLQAPIQLDDQGTMWLVVHPTWTQATEPAWTDGRLTAEIGVLATPRVVTGTKPAVPFRPLPVLGSGYKERGFHVAFDLDVPYDVANERLREAVVGQDFGIGPGRVWIRRVSLYPQGDRAGLDIEVDGVIAMGLKLRGKPVYDEATDSIGFRNVDYEVVEDNVLANFADRMLHEAIRTQLAARLKIPLRDHLEGMRRELEAGLNRDVDGGRLQGKVDRIRLLGLAVKSSALSVRFRTDGELRYEIH